MSGSSECRLWAEYECMRLPACKEKGGNAAKKEKPRDDDQGKGWTIKG